MLTLEKLRDYGADVDDGLARCMNMEAFYLDLVKSTLTDKKLEDLEIALSAKDLDAAFEAAHAMKGMYANLSITPILKPVLEMTELLRARTDTDYSDLLNEAKKQFDLLSELAK